jgi:hypothetical protein
VQPGDPHSFLGLGIGLVLLKAFAPRHTSASPRVLGHLSALPRRIYREDAARCVSTQRTTKQPQRRRGFYR